MTHIQMQADENIPTHVRIPCSKRQTSNGGKLRQTKNKTTSACVPRSKCQMSNADAYLNTSRQKINLQVHVYLILSIRQAVR